MKDSPQTNSDIDVSLRLSIWVIAIPINKTNSKLQFKGLFDDFVKGLLSLLLLSAWDDELLLWELKPDYANPPNLGKLLLLYCTALFADPKDGWRVPYKYTYPAPVVFNKRIFFTWTKCCVTGMSDCFLDNYLFLLSDYSGNTCLLLLIFES